MGLIKKGNKVWLSKSTNPKRKLKYTLEIIEQDNNKVGVNTHSTNKIVYHALVNSLMQYFKNLKVIKQEVKYGKNTRFDFLVVKKKKKIFIEVKNVTLLRNKGIAEFPDSVTSRGLKHIKELLHAQKRGFLIFIIFVIQRTDCNKFTLAKDIDPKYCEFLTKAVKKNLIVL